MSLTLGEKLRQAREERGFTLSEVSEQTRISSLYLESIEHDDYSKLPGGIFNKGFVKSYAKFVGVNEQEALTDYSALLASTATSEESELKLYKPEVLTDDRSGSSMVPTLIKAAIILGLMTAGIWGVLSYFRPSSDQIASNIQQSANTAANTDLSGTPATESPSKIPDMATLKVEFKTTTQPVRLLVTTDGTKTDSVVAAGASVTFAPKESLTLNYNRWNASAVLLSINGKAITLPAEPLNGAADKGRIEFTIDKNSLAQIWAAGAISTDVAPAATPEPEAAVTENPVALPANTPAAATATPAPAATPAPTRAPAANTATNRPAANAGTNTKTRPRPTPSSRPATTPTPKPSANGNP